MIKIRVYSIFYPAIVALKVSIEWSHFFVPLKHSAFGGTRMRETSFKKKDLLHIN